jgi:hypothetical protein
MEYSQPKSAGVLNVSESLISLDISSLRQRAREALTDYLENKLPLIFQESIEGLSQIISSAWEIANNRNTPIAQRLAALSLILDCNSQKLDMASNGSIVEDRIKFAQNAKQRLITIAPEKPRKYCMKKNESSRKNRRNRTSGRCNNYSYKPYC